MDYRSTSLLATFECVNKKLPALFLPDTTEDIKFLSTQYHFSKLSIYVLLSQYYEQIKMDVSEGEKS